MMTSSNQILTKGSIVCNVHGGVIDIVCIRVDGKAVADVCRRCAELK